MVGSVAASTASSETARAVQALTLIGPMVCAAQPLKSMTSRSPCFRRAPQCALAARDRPHRDRAGPGFRRAVGPARKLRREPPRSQMQHARHDRQHAVAAVFLAQGRKPRGAEPRRADLPAQVADHQIGRAAVVANDVLDRAVDAIGGLVADRRQPQAVVIDLARRRARRARHQAADIGLVGDADAEADQLAAMKCRRHRDHVGHMRIAAEIGIVDDETIAFAQAITPKRSSTQATAC